MKKKLLLFASACLLLSTLFVSCHSGKRAARRKAAEKQTVAVKPAARDTKSIRNKYADMLGVKPKNIENLCEPL